MLLKILGVAFIAASSSKAPPLIGPADADTGAEVAIAAELPRHPRLPAVGDLTLWRLAAPHRQIFGERRAVFLRPRSAEALQVMAKLGLSATASAWRPANVDGAQMLELLGSGVALDLAPAPTHRPMLEISVPEIGARAVHLGRGVELSRRGEGVLVGIVDTGLDLTHRAFFDARGASRVVAVWDQDAEGDPPPGFDYGDFCDATAIADDRCQLADSTGHGTHVTGIAAGNDGVAPRADIAVVRSDRFTRLADAVLFLTQLAASRGQPVAINISVGGHYGAHDGRTPLEEFLSRVLRSGEVVVAAAGNDARAGLHVGFTASQAPQRVALENLPWGSASQVTVELWTPVDAALQIELEVYEDDAAVGRTPLRASATEYADGEIRRDGEVVASASYGVDLMPEHHRVRHQVVIEPVGSENGATRSDGTAPRRWMALVISGSGEVDGWLHQSNYHLGMARFGEARGEGWSGGDGRHSVTVPATGRAVIGVGSYVSRVEWVESGAHLQTLPLALGALSPFSSLGPSLAPRVTGAKPDLVAPGTMIVSARAFSSKRGDDGDDAYVALQGTSMAAPHVTGAVALMLEANPHLDHRRVRRMLTETARVPETGLAVVPDVAWGYGKLSVAAAVHRAEGSVRGCAAAAGPWPAVLLASLGLMRAVLRRRGVARR